MTPDPLAHETVACPYPFYDTMCAQSGVSCVADHEWFLVTSFEKASEVLRNPELFSSQSGVAVPAAATATGQRTNPRVAVGRPAGSPRLPNAGQ